MNPTSDGHNRIITLASRRHFSPRKYPNSIVRHAQRVIDWYEQYDKQWNVRNFRQSFFDFGVSRVGFAKFVESIVPVIYTEDEFSHLLKQMGYDVVTEDNRAGINIFVTGDQHWKDRKFLIHILEQIPDKSTIIEGGAPSGVELLMAQVSEQFDVEIREEIARSSTQVRDLFETTDPHVVLVFDDSPREHKRTMLVVELAREYEVPIKILTGTKHVDIEAWLEEVLEYE